LDHLCAEPNELLDKGYLGTLYNLTDIKVNDDVTPTDRLTPQLFLQNAQTVLKKAKEFQAAVGTLLSQIEKGQWDTEREAAEAMATIIETNLEHSLRIAKACLKARNGNGMEEHALNILGISKEQGQLLGVQVEGILINRMEGDWKTLGQLRREN